VYGKIITDIQLTLIELNAYRILNGQSFDFGNGLIINDSKISEDVYWKMEQYDLEELISGYFLLMNEEDYIDRDLKKKKYKYRLNKYERKQIDNKKLNKLYEIGKYSCGISEYKGYLARWYMSGRKKYVKKYSNSKVRKFKDFKLKCAGYRRVFNYWNNVY
jgi:hypothetical protein